MGQLHQRKQDLWTRHTRLAKQRLWFSACQPHIVETYKFMIASTRMQRTSPILVCEIFDLANEFEVRCETFNLGDEFEAKVQLKDVKHSGRHGWYHYFKAIMRHPRWHCVTTSEAFSFPEGVQQPDICVWIQTHHIYIHRIYIYTSHIYASVYTYHTYKHTYTLHACVHIMHTYGSLYIHTYTPYIYMHTYIHTDLLTKSCDHAKGNTPKQHTYAYTRTHT